MKSIITTAALLLTTLAVWSQQVTGRIFDAYTNTPIEGANIVIDGGNATTTDKSGKFTFECKPGVSVKITHVSYETYEGSFATCKEDIQIGLIPNVWNLNAVEVSAVSDKGTRALEEPMSMANLSKRDLNRNTGLFLEESINLEPGIRMEKRTMSGGQRIIIRGYGNSTNFNGVGYKAYLNGIPVTDATGTTILDDIDFSTLGKVEVIKGPASSLYGTGIGGVVNMQTIKPTPQETSVSQQVVGGSYGLFRTNTRLESATDKSSIMLNYGHQGYDSYRVHSASKKDYVSFVGDFRPNEKQTLSTFISYNNSYEELAGQLDSTQFAEKQNVGESRYLGNDAHVKIESFRAGMSHTYKFNKTISNMTSGFVSGSRLEQSYAVGVNDNQDQNIGGRTEFRFNFEGDQVGVNGVVGGEFQKTTAVNRGYAMMDLVLGAPRTDAGLATMQYNAFTQWEVNLPLDFKVIAGASINFIEYSITDRLANSSNPTHADASGYKVFDPVLTPRVALQKTFNNNITAYASVSQGYSPPTTSDAVITYTGEVNDDLTPEFATQYEVGSKGSLLNNKLSWQVALFSMNVQDKLTSQNVVDNTGTVLYSYTVNAGDQVNNGAELSLSYLAINDETKAISYLRPFVTYTYSDFTYDNFKSDANNDANTINYDGNTVVGVPPTLVNAGVDLATKWGFYLNSTFQYVGEMYTTFDNNHKAIDYHLLSGKVGYKTDLGKHITLDVFAGGNNLTNQLYYNMVFFNLSGTSPKLYTPGSYVATFYGGLNFKYRF